MSTVMYVEHPPEKHACLVFQIFLFFINKQEKKYPAWPRVLTLLMTFFSQVKLLLVDEDVKTENVFCCPDS